MALRIRKNGRVFCAAMTKPQKGDIYIDDNLHYYLSVEKRLLVAEPLKKHKKSKEWWWITELKENNKFIQVI